MPVNALTTDVGLRVGPVILGTLIKHYLDRRKKDDTEQKSPTLHRQDELLYDEVFHVIKEFLRVASYHTVEDVQGFANTRTPSPPWVHVVRLIIPMSSCNEAAKYLIKAFGGEDETRRVVGGVKWWQVRGIDGVDAQWITAMKDWKDAKRRYKMQEQARNGAPLSPPVEQEGSGKYEKDMDEMRCILYSHGGGYYFGSVDQERYSIQRHARKINGRVFAINYRLAPQYPFPCALQDLLAAYLFLIRPPPGSDHRAVDPALVVIAGDSAGGGLSLALLQVIRDSGLPMPAGGVLISPWCDLTHSFPSVHTNTATDIMPPWGLSFQKPSALWPPPTDDMARRVHASLRTRLRQAFRMEETQSVTATMLSEYRASSSAGEGGDAGPPASLPVLDPPSQQTISLTTRSGEVLTTTKQLHMYTQNSLLPHPLISPVLSYLGGLPPLLVIAGDGEVLRDEILYMAHKAAHPDEYPIRDEARILYPALNDIEDRRLGPTKVHLQVYDEAPHVITVLFSFTTPAKFCFRAIAAFCRFVTGMVPIPSSPVPSPPKVLRKPSRRAFSANREKPASNQSIETLVLSKDDSQSPKPASPVSLKRSLSESINRATSIIRPGPRLNRASTIHDSEALPLPPPLPVPPSEATSNSSEAAGPKRSNSASPEIRTAGHPGVYGDLMGQPWDGTMIRERVSTQGVIRPLEPTSSLGAFDVQPGIIGQVSELAIRRYLDAHTMFEKKFSHTIKKVDEERRRHLKLSKKDTQRSIELLQQSRARDAGGDPGGEGLGNWAWVLDGEETPPPSSIAARRDTSEARRLAHVADQAALQEEQTFSGNRFWAAIVNLLTADPSVPKDTPQVRAPSKISRLFRCEPVETPST